MLTGETGAGKTVLAHALDLLLGGRARPGIVRPGAEEAYVEGVFELDARDGERSGRIVLARRRHARRGARARTSTGARRSAADLRSSAAPLLSFYGQHEHRKLMLASAQLELLDAFCGAEHLRRASGAGGRARARCASSRAR